MIKLAIFALLILAVPVFAKEERLKIGTVDMQRLFKGYYRAEVAQKECNVELARLQKQNGERLSRIREIDEGLEKLRKKLEDPTIAESKKNKLLQQEVKNCDASANLNDIENYGYSHRVVYELEQERKFYRSILNKLMKAKKNG